MVAGLKIFSEHFKGMESRFVIIGGTACDLWLGKEGFKFRETKDIDMVLVVEALDTAFIEHFWSFVKAGRYSAFRSPKCLIPLKARAYLDLKKRKEAGAQNVKGTDIKKHRNDVFRLYLSLKPEDSFDLPEVLKNDLREFLSAFSSGNTDWEDIGKSLGKNLLGSPETAIRNLKGIFKL